jgi:hypothetical protein
MIKTRIILIIIVLLAVSINSFSQSKDELEQLAATPKTSKTFPLTYKISLPRLEFRLWDNDFDVFYSFLTPTLKKTQATISFSSNGVNTMINPNSILPHAQLDTNTIIKNTADLMGTWRMVTYRSIRFNDSVDIPAKKYYRMPDTLLDDKSSDEVFAMFSDDQFQLHVKEVGKKSFKKVGSSKYTIESKRYLMLYKLFKAGSGVSQMGMDENGYLILNYPKVIENVKKGEYISYYAIIEQYIFEKIR